MMNDEEAANIVTLIEDLQTDLANGNLPAAKLLIISIVNCLLLKQPLEWKMLGAFVSDNLEDKETRLSLLKILPKVIDLVCPFQPVEEAEPE